VTHAGGLSTETVINDWSIAGCAANQSAMRMNTTAWAAGSTSIRSWSWPVLGLLLAPALLLAALLLRILIAHR
jgi:hypothetical protein